MGGLLYEGKSGFEIFAFCLRNDRDFLLLLAFLLFQFDLGEAPMLAGILAVLCSVKLSRRFHGRENSEKKISISGAFLWDWDILSCFCWFLCSYRESGICLFAMRSQPLRCAWAAERSEECCLERNAGKKYFPCGEFYAILGGDKSYIRRILQWKHGTRH